MINNFNYTFKSFLISTIKIYKFFKIEFVINMLYFIISIGFLTNFFVKLVKTSNFST